MKEKFDQFPTKKEYNIEEYKAESIEIEGFVDAIEAKLSQKGFDAFRPGFWLELTQAENELAVEKMRNLGQESESGRVVSDFDPSRKRSVGMRDVIESRALPHYGYDFYFANIYARDCFNYLKNAGLLTETDKESFIKSACYFGPEARDMYLLDEEAFKEIESVRVEAFSKLSDAHKGEIENIINLTKKRFKVISHLHKILKFSSLKEDGEGYLANLKNFYYKFHYDDIVDFAVVEKVALGEYAQVIIDGNWWDTWQDSTVYVFGSNLQMFGWFPNDTK